MRKVKFYFVFDSTNSPFFSVSIDELTEKLTEFEDYVQSVDIAAFQKI